MKIFHCDHCGQLLFFENTECVSCGHSVAYLPDLGVVGSLDPPSTPDGAGPWRSPLPRADSRGYKLCRNYTIERTCNWAIPAADANPLCLSCRTTRVIPNLDDPLRRAAWYRLEVAKRRLLFTLIELRLPMTAEPAAGDRGLTFEFLADAEPGAPPVLTGHSGGVITINIAEADDAERERRRAALREPYRTLLGHMRHESGHYYWDRLVGQTPLLEQFRSLFGDERADYAAALAAHYQQPVRSDWQATFVSEYASAHPAEDWAETWAHYLHMVDTLETAAACGLSLRPRRRDEPAVASVPAPVSTQPASFEQLIDSWFPLTYVLNNLNRGLGRDDAYPFVLSPAVIAKLRFVDEVIGRSRAARGVQPATHA